MDSSFQKKTDKSTHDEWLTPQGIITALGGPSSFALDPCSPAKEIRPWATAQAHLSKFDDGLAHKWDGRVWANIPYSQSPVWMEKMAKHNHGIALLFQRCETQVWFDPTYGIWKTATSFLFLGGRLKFWEFVCSNCGCGASKHNEKHHCQDYEPDGEVVEGGTAGTGSVLISYGKEDAEVLRQKAIANNIAGHECKWFPNVDPQFYSMGVSK